MGVAKSWTNEMGPDWAIIQWTIKQVADCPVNVNICWHFSTLNLSPTSQGDLKGAVVGAALFQEQLDFVSGQRAHAHRRDAEARDTVRVPRGPRRAVPYCSSCYVPMAN